MVLYDVEVNYRLVSLILITIFATRVFFQIQNISEPWTGLELWFGQGVRDTSGLGCKIEKKHSAPAPKLPHSRGGKPYGKKKVKKACPTQWLSLLRQNKAVHYSSYPSLKYIQIF